MSKRITISEAKEQFSLNALWGGSIRSSFQRSGVYKKGSTDKAKIAFKNELKAYVFDLISQYEGDQVDEVAHLVNIKRLQSWTKNHAPIFNEGKMRYGICQKLLNVYLKELWCAGKINSEPPHLPVDRLIQEKLKLKPIVSWTLIESEEEYMQIIERIRVVAKSRGLSLSELELVAYNELVKDRK